MKQKIILLAFISIFACSKKDDTSSTPVSQQGNIVNKWKLTSIVENGIAITGYTCNSNFDITEFTASGISITKFSNNSSTNPCLQLTENGKYTVANNILEDIQRNGSNVIIYKAQYKILELTATNLKLSLLYQYETNSNGTNPYTSNYAEGQQLKLYTKI